jgi:hypothetical protein
VNTPKKPGRNRNLYQDVLEQVARAIHGRHPRMFERRDLGVGGVEKKLEAILKHKHVPASEAAVYLRQIDRNPRGDMSK